jgi:hypothetical protein
VPAIVNSTNAAAAAIDLATQTSLIRLIEAMSFPPNRPSSSRSRLARIDPQGNYHSPDSG